MASSVEQQLLGYLLGALDDAERETLEAEFQRDPQLREQLLRLRRRIEPLRCCQSEADPPPGLAKQTCELVVAYAATHSEPAAAPAAPIPVLAETPAPLGFAPTARPWNWADFTVLTGIVLAAIAIIFPAIQGSRFRSQLLTCQDHLRQLGQSLTEYSSCHRGVFPSVSQESGVAVAGIYAPVLLRDGFLDDKHWVLCPGSALANDPQFRVPSLDELKVATANELSRLRAAMGGSYGYALGYVEDGQYRPTRNLGRVHFALMSDAPNHQLPGYQSLNHGGQGQNVLFEDGHVSFLTSSKSAGPGDDFFVNDVGAVAPGKHRDDSVIADSATALPIVLVNSGQGGSGE